MFPFRDRPPFNDRGEVSRDALREISEQAGSGAALQAAAGMFSYQTVAGQLLVPSPPPAPGLWVKVTSATPQTVTLAGGATASGYPALVETYSSVTGAWADGAACWFVGANAEVPASGSRYLVGLAGQDGAGKGIYSTEVPAASAYGLASSHYDSGAISVLTGNNGTGVDYGGTGTTTNASFLLTLAAGAITSKLPAGATAPLANVGGSLDYGAGGGNCLLLSGAAYVTWTPPLPAAAWVGLGLIDSAASALTNVLAGQVVQDMSSPATGAALLAIPTTFVAPSGHPRLAVSSSFNVTITRAFVTAVLLA